MATKKPVSFKKSVETKPVKKAEVGLEEKQVMAQAEPQVETSGAGWYCAICASHLTTEVPDSGSVEYTCPKCFTRYRVGRKGADYFVQVTAVGS